MFSGCDLSIFTAIEKNTNKYLSQTVATTSNGIKLSMEELIVAFNSYGYKYESEQSMTREEAIKETLNMEINRTLAVNFVKNYSGTEYDFTITNADLNGVWESVYSYVNTQLSDYETEIRTEKGITSTTPTDAEVTKGTTKTAYTAKARVVNGEIELIPDETVVDENQALIGSTENFYQSMMDNRTVSTLEISNLALSRYVKALVKSEEGRNRSTKTEEVLSREVERVYNVYLKNMYISKLETEYNKKNPVTEEQVLNKFKALVRDQYATYQLDSSQFYTDATSSSTDNYYIADENEFYYVSHILLAYTDEQTALLTTWKTQLSTGEISQGDYDSNVEWLKTQITVQARNTDGVYYGTAKSATQILTEIQNAVNSKSLITDKCETFNELIYKYNSDPGIMNAEFNYVVGENHSDMVDEFNTASRELFEIGEGALSGLVFTEYGAHVILYTNKVKNVIAYSNLDSITLEKLATTRLQLGESKTWFDKIYDTCYSTVTASNFSDYEQDLIDVLRENITIKFNKSVYKSLMD